MTKQLIVETQLLRTKERRDELGISNSSTLYYANLDLKIYRWNLTPNTYNTIELVLQALPEELQVSNIGLAFTFGYKDLRGNQFLGVDFMQFPTHQPNNQGESRRIYVNRPVMIRAWSMEKPNDSETFVKMDAGKNGIMCGPEAVILAEEYKILDKCILPKRGRPIERQDLQLDLEQYLATWPNLDQYDGRK